MIYHVLTSFTDYVVTLKTQDYAFHLFGHDPHNFAPWKQRSSTGKSFDVKWVKGSYIRALYLFCWSVIRRYLFRQSTLIKCSRPVVVNGQILVYLMLDQNACRYAEFFFWFCENNKMFDQWLRPDNSQFPSEMLLGLTMHKPRYNPKPYKFYFYQVCIHIQAHCAKKFAAFATSSQC